MAVQQCFLILSIVTLFVLGEEHHGILDTNDCYTYCHDEQPDIKSIESCQRGCRFYSIAKLIGPNNAPNEDAFHEPNELGFRCRQDCKEAYPPAEIQALSTSCNSGCGKQEQILQDDETEEAEEDHEWRNATPVLQVRKVMAQVVGRFQVLRTSVMTYFLKDDNTLLAVQSEPQIIVEMLPFPIDESSEKTLDSNIPLMDNQEAAFPPLLHSTRLQPEVHRVALGDSRQYVYLLHLLMLLGAVSLTLLGLSYCLAIVRHQQRKTNKAANLGVVLHHEPLKLVRPEDLTKLSLMEEEEAPPLPSKQDLALTHANV